MRCGAQQHIDTDNANDKKIKSNKNGKWWKELNTIDITIDTIQLHLNWG